VTLDPDYTIIEVAEALGMSERWLRGKIKTDKLEHQEYGHKIKFTAEQVQAIRDRYKKRPAPVEQITTGKKKSA
jgi:hypothetical protein